MSKIPNITADLNQVVKSANKIMTSKKDLISFDTFKGLDFVKLKNKGVVYFLYVTDKKTKETTLKYIGKSKGHLFKQRITNHIDHSNEKTGTKRSYVEMEIAKQNSVSISYLTTEPESLRNLIEEELINCSDKTQLWNGKKKNAE